MPFTSEYERLIARLSRQAADFAAESARYRAAGNPIKADLFERYAALAEQFWIQATIWHKARPNWDPDMVWHYYNQALRNLKA